MNEAMIELLFRNEADVDARDRHGRTALHDAACWGHDTVVRLLLEKGADINTENKGGQTALHCAAAQERPNIDTGIKSDGMLVVELFLEKGADVHRTDRWGMTALYEAARTGHEQVVGLLLKKEADVNAKDREMERRCMRRLPRDMRGGETASGKGGRHQCRRCER